MFYNFFIIYVIKENRDVMLNRAKVYYESDKKRLPEQARSRYRNVCEEDQNKKKNMGKTDIIICLKRKNKD